MSDLFERQTRRGRDLLHGGVPVAVARAVEALAGLVPELQGVLREIEGVQGLRPSHLNFLPL